MLAEGAWPAASGYFRQVERSWFLVLFKGNGRAVCLDGGGFQGRETKEEEGAGEREGGKKVSEAEGQ